MIYFPQAIPFVLAALLTSSTTTGAFQSLPSLTTRSPMSVVSLMASPNNNNQDEGVSTSNNNNPLLDRRQWFLATAATTGLFATSANAQIFLDPAMYGDQELRVSAVDTVRESVRRSILQNPELAPSFYQLAMIDALSYQANTGQWGPDGWSVYAALATKDVKTTYMKNLQMAANSLLETERRMKQKNAITLADAVAIAGAESIESIGGPVLPVQLGRADHKGPLPNTVPLDLFSGDRSNAEVVDAFRKAGMTEREMTALLAGLLTLEKVEAARTTEDWKQSVRPKFREAGKLGRMSEFKPLTEEDIAQAELDEELEDPDDGWYIADSFGTRESRFGQRLAKDDINEQVFNKYLQMLVDEKKRKNEEFGWTADLLLDSANVPTAVTWVKKYAGANLSFTKDLKIAYNAATQLGAQYTGGKYENLLKNKPRKTLNDDGLNLF